MKAIILAAGMGTRLGKYTQDLPKCMLNFNGKTLIQRQIETLKKAGIENILVIKGFNEKKIQISGVKYYINKDYSTTNMVATLMVAEKEFDDDILICYGDIIYELETLKKIMNTKYEISVLADDNWIEYWKARLENWQDDVESLIYDENDNITDIGNTKCELKDAQSRYVGLIKFSKSGIEKFKKIYNENKKKYWDMQTQWKRSKSFKQAYMTCMLQEMIDRKETVKVIHCSHGWMEFDTVEDYEKAILWLKTGKIKKFINL